MRQDTIFELPLRGAARSEPDWHVREPYVPWGGADMYIIYFPRAPPLLCPDRKACLRFSPKARPARRAGGLKRTITNHNQDILVGSRYVCSKYWLTAVWVIPCFFRPLLLVSYKRSKEIKEIIRPARRKGNPTACLWELFEHPPHIHANPTKSCSHSNTMPIPVLWMRPDSRYMMWMLDRWGWVMKNVCLASLLSLIRDADMWCIDPSAKG